MTESQVPIRVFVADDDQDDCVVLTDALAEATIQTDLTCFSNGVLLMEGLKSGINFPHVLLLDLNMPLKDGMDCLNEIRADRALDKIVIIIYSTSAQPEAVESAFRAGANLFIKKPDSFTKLKIVMDRMLDLYLNSKLYQVQRSNFLMA